MGQPLSGVNEPKSGRPTGLANSFPVAASELTKRRSAGTPTAAMAAEKTSLSPRERLGRRVGIAVFGLIVGGATATWTIQILMAVFAPTVDAVATDCRSGTRGLLVAVRRARLAAASENGDERAALASFRAALEPEWSARTSLTSVCRSDPKAQTALTEIDALRYAEEHAVRYEAVGLAPQRRRVQALNDFESDGQKRPALP
jgi:hypothetical protein